MANMHTPYYKLDNSSVVTILGGNGFVGKHIAVEVAKSGAIIKIIARNASDAKQLMTAGYVGQIALIDMDVKNQAKLEEAIKSSDVVINTIGLLYSKGKQNFKSMHVELASDLGKLCSKHHIKRLIHISALGVSNVTDSAYAQSKLEGEKQLLRHYPSAIILRPSVIFGPEDNFINLFNSIANFSPFIPLIGGGRTKFQPVYVMDVARAVVQVLQPKYANICGKVLELGGPNVLSLKEILQVMLNVAHKKRCFLTIPFSVAEVQAAFMELLPKPLLTRDQLKLLKHSNVLTSINGLKVLDIAPTPLKTGLTQYFKS